MSLLPVEDALRLILARVPAPEPETVGLDQASGRVLLESVVARRNQPPFAASAMDGYAVRAEDVRAGEPLRLIGVSQAGDRFAGHLQPGNCVRILTGAPVPEGADAVIPQEEADLDGASVRFAARPQPGRSIRTEGYDFAEGQVLLGAGVRLSPGQLALAAAANLAQLTVSRTPRIAILATGDELVLPGTEAGPDQIASSNSFALAAMLRPYASAVADLGIARDDPDALEAIIAPQLSGASELVVISGGASVGDRDYLREVLLGLGVELEFWKIAIRPGKPMMFGRKGDVLVFGLPGNPVSAMVTAEILVKPALRQWLGLGRPEGPRMRLPLSAPLGANGPRRHYLRAVIENGDCTMVRPITETDSGHLSSFASADALIIQPENFGAIAPGEIVEVVPLDSF